MDLVLRHGELRAVEHHEIGELARLQAAATVFVWRNIPGRARC
jgi:hypothetical protein